MAKNGGVETLLSWQGEKIFFLQKPANMRAGASFSLRCFVAVILVNPTAVICISFSLHTEVQRWQKLHSANWNSWHFPEIYYRDAVSLLFQLMSHEPVFTQINYGTLYPKLSYCTKMFLS